ncbi:MAG: hypothetical protein BWK80_19660 [Desulfobacteraceae bacterium IS3]|nr:MAG: hypothetical protein BWK80_19660 [Desulfobacteraceae bacterium IS3]
MTQEELLKILRRAEDEGLTELDLSEYEITHLPPEISRLSALEVLIVRGLNSLPPEIGQLRNLNRLYLSSNEIRNLPPEIGQLKNLTGLTLSSNLLTELPPEIGLLKNLTGLNLSYNLLTELPEEMMQLRNLTGLNLSFNQLKKLPEDMGQLKNLSRLYLDSNQLNSVPASFAQMRSLTELNLSFNQFGTVPEEIFLLRNLAVLYLDSNRLTMLPPEIGGLANLTELNLSSNRLSALPPEIGQIKNLTRLYAAFNELRELPREIIGLRNLQILDLSSNRLTKLPPEITELKDLTVIYLDSNQMSRLPREIGDLKKLIHLDLNRNPLTFPPLEIASQGLSAVMDYLKKSDKGGKTLYEGKLLFVGQGGVGKTCLMRRLISGQYSGTQPTTEGIDIASWRISVPNEAKTEMTLNVWDFGGQEIYHATHQFFLTQRSLYILVWDARQEEEYARIDYWLNCIQTFAEDSPILVVMNKADERDKDLNFKEMRERCPQVAGAKKVSAKNNTGIEELRNFIAKQAYELPLMGTFWPTSWLTVRETLNDSSRYHVPYKNYLKVCRQLDIEESEAKTLSRYLHDLGIILHFQDDPVLKDTIILKPEWGTDAVYKVLDARVVQDRNGILYLKDLPKIWANRTLYPKDKYQTILRLMANFELAFPFGEGERYIVTEFLSLKECVYDWNPKESIRFEYHYDFLPAGVITRLIVRMHEFLIERDGEKLCWREGAYFEHQGTLAQVRINPYSKIAGVEIEGPGKKEFLIEVRLHFAAIHKSMQRICFKEKIPCLCGPDCNHRFDYNFLLKCEEKGMKHVLCEKTAEHVSVEKLLNSIETTESRIERVKEKREGKYRQPRAEVNPILPARKEKFKIRIKTLVFILALLFIIAGIILR